MQLICPKCGSRFEMEQAVKELEQKETYDIAAKLGVHWRLVYEYTDCFRQGEFGDVRLAKRLRILKEAARLIETGAFSYHGKRYRTSQAEVLRAMTEICNLNKSKFKNHNYLYSILTNTAEGLSAEGLTAKEEQKRELNRRAGDGGKELDSGFRWNDGEKEPGKVDFRGLVTHAKDEK
jgi:hypothetical protein